MTFAIGVDLGGTKIAAGLVDENGAVVAQERRPTPTDSASAVVAEIVSVMRALSSGVEVTGACVAVPGFVDATRSRLLFAPNLPMTDVNLRQELEQAMKFPVMLENDANAATWAEARFGAARNSRNMVMLTIGTGLGGGIVVERNLLRGAFGMGGEVGHMTLVPDGVPCGCGQRGCWEQYVSGTALVRHTRALVAADPSAAKTLLALGDGTVEGVSGPHITTAAIAGCPVSIAAFEWLGEQLGRGMASISALLDPHKFVIGGGVCAAGEILLAPTRKTYLEHLTGGSLRPIPDIVVATMGNDAGLIGAADLARSA